MGSKLKNERYERCSSSLVNFYDDLMRNTEVLTRGIEAEFIASVSNKEECRIKWHCAEKQLENITCRIKTLESDKLALETKLKHTRDQLDHEQRKRHKAEEDRDALERQLGLVRELLMNDKNSRSVLNDEKLAWLSNNTIQPSMLGEQKGKALDTIDESGSILSDVSFDKTDEGLDGELSMLRSGRRWKRRKTPSAPPLEDDEDVENMPVKKHKRSTSNRKSQDQANTSITTKTTITLPHDGRPMTAVSEICTDLPKASTVVVEQTPNPVAKEPEYTNYVPKTPKTPGSPILRSNSSAGKLNRAHIFAIKTAIRIENCSACGKRLRFGRNCIKCRDCRATAHPECKDKVPLPCIPATPATPGMNKGEPCTIADYASDEAPMIPALVIHCIKEVESRGFYEAGLYRVPGAEKDVRELKEKFFKGRGMPNLASYADIHVICGCLKTFLRGLKEPLVTYDLWQDFVNAADLTRKDYDEALCSAYQAISLLPQPNRDTMAYLVVHLQRVAESPDCKMPISNLAKVFGPTVVGYSTPNPEPMQMINETKTQAMVMELMMNIPSDYWNNFIVVEEQPSTIYNYPNGTPEARPVPSSMLGPATTPSSKKAHNILGITPHQQRNGNRGRHFFSSPHLK